MYQINLNGNGKSLSPPELSHNLQEVPGSRNFLGLLTDLDNTLYDFAAAQESACQAVIRVTGAGDYQGLIRAFLFSPYGVESHVPIRTYLQDLGITDEAIIRHACSEFETVKKTAIIPFPGVVETLRIIHAAGIRIGAITNASSGNAGDRLVRIGVRDLFSSLVSPDSSGLKKPDPEMYEKAVDVLGVPVARICVIGDNLVNDIAPALLLGMYTVHARYGDRLPPEFAGDAVPDAVVDSFADLLPILGLH